MKFIIDSKENIPSIGIPFEPVFCAPWVRGFYKEEPWFYVFFKMLGMNWKHTSFMAKTITLDPHEGNVPLKKDGRPQYPFTRYVYWNPFKTCMVNSFGLSNPGFRVCSLRWKTFNTPFVVSVISLKETRSERYADFEMLVIKLKRLKNEANVSFAIQFNAGCPNDGPQAKGADEAFIEELNERALQLRKIGLPILLNCAPVMPFPLIMQTHEHWDGLVIGNTVLFGKEGIDWTRVTPDGVSPLIKRGLDVLGGYSGKEATHLSVSLIARLRKIGVTMPIIGGNSIQSKEDVDAFADAGASAVFIGSIALNNPFKMKEVIEYAHTRRWKHATAHIIAPITDDD